RVGRAQRVPRPRAVALGRPRRSGGCFVATRRSHADRRRCARRSAGTAGALAQAFEIEVADDPAIGLQQAFALEAREKTTHRFEREAEVVADLRARHPEYELA